MDEKPRNKSPSKGVVVERFSLAQQAPGVCGKGMDADMMRVMMKAMPK